MSPKTKVRIEFLPGGGRVKSEDLPEAKVTIEVWPEAKVIRGGLVCTWGILRRVGTGSFAPPP